MAWDINTGRLKAGVADNSRDGDITLWMSTAIAIAERYCDRGLEFKAEQVKFYDICQEYINLPRYPVERLVATNPSTLGKYHLHRAAGRVLFHGHRFFDEIDITYEGGYRTFPPDLELALWSVFGALWGTYGGSSGAVPTVTVGEIKKKTIVGVGSVEFTTSADAMKGSGGAGGSGLDLVMPGAVMGLLEPYRKIVA